jgi:silicon transporter
MTDNYDTKDNADGVVNIDMINPFQAHQRDDDDDASIGDDSQDEKMNIHVADEHGNIIHYPNEDETQVQQKDLDPKKKKEAAHSVIGAGIESIKYLYSMALLIFSVITVMAAIFSEQTVATAEKGIPSIVAFFIFWFLICWLAMMEGGQGALVGLQPIDKALYADSHPRALKCTQLAHKGDNMERFIVGRQFLVVLVVFVINLMASAIKDADVLGLNETVKEIFLSTSIVVILVTIMLGQLTAQVNAANCMLDFINNYFMLFTTYVSLAIEMSGLLHSVYLVQIVFSKITGKPIETKEEPRNTIQNLFFWGRVLMSLAILGFAFAVTLKALFDGNTTMWAGVPKAVSVIVLFVLMCFVGMMEGMQIALFAVVNLPEEELQQHTIAHKNCQLTFSGQNLQAFLIGRQICVTICMFVVARITTLDIGQDEANIFGVSDGLQEFFNTGLLGAVITTIVASLMWRIIASSFPIAFLSNPLIYLIIRLCLLLEKSGVCSAAWVLARYHKPIINYQPDEVHLEGAEPHTAEPVTRRDKDIDRLVTVFKFSYSLALLAFVIILVMAAIFQEQTTAADKGIHPAAAFFIFWFLICWLGMMEGGQGALVGLQPIEKDRYSETHPKTLLNTRLAHMGDNMERFIVGRQFLVVLVVFVINMMAFAIKDPEVLGLNQTIIEIFFNTGIAVILVTIMLGQLTAQVNAANCMLDFLNNYFMLFTTYVSLAIEMSGLLHSVYLVQILFSKITGKAIDSKEPPRSAIQNLFFWGRVLMSLAILGFAFAVTLKALFDGNTTMWAGVPEAVSVIVFFVLMCFVGMMEGMQIALFAVVNLPEEELKQHSVAYANCQLTFRDQNLQAFLIGRQICVTICMFVVARITTLDIAEDEPNIFGVSDGLQEFFNTGLLGAVITTLVASLMWRIIASSFPLAFLSNPLIYLIIRLCLLLEASGVCSAAWVTGRWNKKFVSYQPDEVYLEGAEPHTKAPVTRRDKDVDITVTVIKYVYSMALLIFSVTVVMATIFGEKTKLSQDGHPVLAFFVIWGLILWLAMMEGGQGCLVGLQPIEKDLYDDSHPITLKSTMLAHKGDNMERFIVGRQFLVVLVVFVTNLSGLALKDTEVLDLPKTVNDIFVGSGVAMILMTIILGQLTAQVNAANCMLDFINTYFMVFTTYVSLAIEFSGLLHSVYLVQIFFSKITGTPIDSNEPPRSAVQNLFFWGRVLMSTVVLAISFVVTLSALFAGKTTMWDGVPEAVSVIVFFVLMCFVGMMEGMQIALFAVVNLPEEELQNHALAYKTCQLTFSGNNLQAFLIGRQICVTICMFVVARITTITIEDGESNVLGVSDGLQEFFNTGLLGAIITTLVASLAWRIIASSFPVAFLSNPLVYLIIRLCLVLEATGVCSAAWLLALIHKAIVGYQLDEVYIGTPAERAEAKKNQATELTLQEEAPAEIDV